MRAKSNSISKGEDPDNDRGKDKGQAGSKGEREARSNEQRRDNRGGTSAVGWPQGKPMGDATDWALRRTTTRINLK